MPASLHHR